MNRLATLLALIAALTLSTSQVSAAIIGSTEVQLNGQRDDVRIGETNLGNLVADAYYWQTQKNGLSPTIAFLNSGSLRNDSIVPIGDIDSTLPLSILPFNNEILVIEDVTVSDLHLALENSVSEALETFPRGYMAQISGFLMSWDTSQAVGNRIIDVFLDDGTPLIDNGVVVSAMLLDIATNSFLAGGGDGYSMFPGSYTSTGTGIVDNVALSNFIQDGLSGVVSAADYQNGVESRIFRNQQLSAVPTPTPATLALFGMGLFILCWSRNKKA